MICGYNGNCVTERSCERCPDGFSKCMNGMMILVGVLAGLVFAAAAVLLFLNGLLPSLFPAALTMLIAGLAVMLTVLAAALFLPDESKGKSCIRCHVGGLFFGILGTIVSSLFLVAADLAAGSIAAAVLLGLSVFFFADLLVAVLFVVLCASDC